MSDEQDAGFGPDHKKLDATAEERNLALLMHVLAFFTGFIGPLVIWVVKKDDSPFIDQHGKEALNFQLSILIYSLPIAVIAFLTCGLGALLLLPLFALIVTGCVLAAMQGHRGEACNYPLTIHLLQ